jgi:YD repeat-containing protein
MSELLITLPSVLLIGLGTLQSILFHDAKVTLNYATFEAARRGAVNHAQSDVMREELGLRLAPLYGGDGSAQKAIAAITRASLDVQDRRYTEIEIINPTIEAFDEYGREILDPGTDEVHFGIPNTHLRWRDRSVGTSGVNIQDANLLKIKVTYGYSLKLPLIDRLLPALMRHIDPQHSHYYNARRLPITSVATVRMQSDAWRDENNVHMHPSGASATALTTQDDPGQGQTPPNEEEGQGGYDNSQSDGETPTESAEDDSDSHTAESEGDDLPPIAEGDDQGRGACDNPATPADESASPASQGNATASTQIANPIHVVTGNKYQQEVDLSPLPGPLGLLFKRHYNSHSEDKGPLGYGWRHSYELSLKPAGEGYRLHQSDGRVIHFSPNEDHPEQFSAPRHSDGWLQVNQAQLTWHWRDGRQLQFNPQGQLRRIVMASGQTLTLYYDPQGEFFLVRDPQGRQLSLDHYPNGRIKAFYDPSGKATRYRYDEIGNLHQVIRPDGTTRIYHYEDPHDRHNLTGITDERGERYASWAYDEQDRAIRSTHAEQVGQVSLDFTTPGQTQVRQPGQAQHLHQRNPKRRGISQRHPRPGLFQLRKRRCQLPLQRAPATDRDHHPRGHHPTLPLRPTGQDQRDHPGSGRRAPPDPGALRLRR